MSDTAAALRAAREAQADTLSPELYREANDWWLKARQEYKFKNFGLAEEFAEKARVSAEQAEYNAIKQGAARIDISAPDEPEPSLPANPDAYETPTGRPVESFTNPDPSGSNPSPKPNN